IKDKKLQQSGAINSIKEDVIDIDKNLDSGNVSEEILLKRMELTRQLHDINQMEARDYVQKSKIKWAIEGDKNLKFFHGIINKKRSQLSIRGVFVDGDWNTDPEVVKDVFKHHFATRFKQPAHGRLKLNIPFPNRLSTYQVVDMDRSVSRNEIRVAFWNCGENKSPGPDGYTFEFFRRYWRFIGSDFCSVVECFFESGSPVNGEVDNNPALVLDESCLNLQDYSRCLMGKVKDFGSLSNLKVVLGSEGFDNIDIRYLGGFWVMIKFLSDEVKKKFQSNVGTGTWFSQLQQASTDFITDRRVTWVELEGIPLKLRSENTFKRLASKWGALLHIDNPEEVCFYRKRICIATTCLSNILESFKIIYQGKAYWVRAKEVPGWVLGFVEQDDEERDNEKDVIPDTVFEDKLPKSYDGEASLEVSACFTPKEYVETNVEQSKKMNGYVRDVGEDANRSNDMKSGSEIIISKEEGTESVCSGHFKKSETPRSGGSIQSLMDELVNVGQTMGYNMDGCVKNIEEIIESQGANENGEVIVMGDFNKVRTKNERFGSVFNVQGANAFNSFISSAGLEEVPLGATTLDRYLSDHRPIFLCESKHDYRHVPFLFFQYWLEVDGFEKLVNETWSEAPVDMSNDMLKLMKKLKYLKKKIRAWNNDIRKYYKNNKLTFKAELENLDSIIDKGEGNDDIINKRMAVVKSIQELDKLQSMKAVQKAKIKWAIEGDENSKYYHGILNKKRHQLFIQGVLANRTWIDNLVLVKNEFLSHFKNRVDKSSGPDGFTFGFYRHFWKLIENDVVAAVKYFFQIGSIPKCCNSSFIALILKIPDAKMVKDFRPISLIDIVNEVQSAFVADRQILDGQFILNELFQLCKSKKKHSFIFKVDFEKAYDSGSMIVNGSPTEEVQFFKGLKQGDPLSLFLFILIMESLHISFQRVVDAGVFKGNVDSNIDTIVHVLECFYRASGLRINMSKSKLMRIAMDVDRVEQAASKIRFLRLYALESHKRIDVVAKLAHSSVAYSFRRAPRSGLIDLPLEGYAFIWAHKSDSKMSILDRFLISEAIHGNRGALDSCSRRKKVGNGENTSFWDENLLGDDISKSNYPRLYALEEHKTIYVADKLHHPSLVHSFRKLPRELDSSGSFLVKSARNFIDDISLPKAKMPTGWVKVIPIK
nr:RNA-directed DNA polymerase, eukaryota [Tanacetum cinerariifolium]